MTPNPVHRLPAPLEAAVQRLKLAARESAERTIESLGLAALASNNAFHRDGLLGAQFELNRKSAVFVLTFNEAFDERMLRELGPRAVAAATNPGDGSAGLPPAAAPAPQAPTNWDALSLVEDKEVEAQISAERFGMDIAHACEWELRELQGYVSALLGDDGSARERNPLRPDLVGHAMIRGVEAVSDRADIRKVLSAELSRSLATLLQSAYADIVVDLRNAGVQPMGMSVRNRAPRGAGVNAGSGAGSGAGAGPAAADDAAEYGGPAFDSTGGRGGLPGAPGRSGAGRSSFGAGHAPADSRYGARGPASGGFVSSTRTGGPGSVYTHHGHGPGHGMPSRSGTPIGQVDPALMTLIRRLAYSEPGAEPAYADHSGNGSDGGGLHSAPLPNLIRAHRDELRQASRGSLDHMVIDVIGFLFDQILADPKVPPQLARQIARLQLPVLRAALGDPSFFSSRRHPVRRFINRIASLGAAFEDFGDEGGKNFLAKVRALVQEVVEGDFDQLETYELKLAELEAFTAEMAAREAQGPGAAGEAAVLLAEKEDQQRLRQLYAQRLAGELKDLAAPPFLREFISSVWSQVLLRAAEPGGAGSHPGAGPTGALVQRLRGVASALFLSVQPKATPAHRKAFLTELPRLMQDLTDGMNLIAWPEAQRRAFFGQLMPAHAEALKSPAGRQLDINLLARQMDSALQRPPPSRADLKSARALPVLTEEIAPTQFSADEVQRAGLVQESAIDWNGAVDIDISGEPAPTPADAQPVLPGLPASTEAAAPTEGRALADLVQIGFAYQMHVDGNWQKVRLAHVSAARSFFIFTHGARHKKTISLTQRMLHKLCETGRFKAFERAELIDRATARARRQLAAVSA